MSDGHVHEPEMPSSSAPYDLDDPATEAFLAGRSVAAGEVGLLASFRDDVKAAVGGPPPVPTGQLATLLREGFSIDTRSHPALHEAAASAGTGWHRSTRRRRRMTISELLGALATKLAGLGLTAKAALGLGLATATAATAGAAGVLPGPAQHAVATIVDTVTPLHFPDGSDGGASTPPVAGSTGIVPPDANASPGAEPSSVAAATTDGTHGTDGTGDSHGACVSAVAKSAPTGAGGVHGQAVSAAAKSCPKADDGKDETTTATSTVAEDTGHTATAGATTERGPSANHGPGNGQGGNSGQGNGQGGSGSHGLGNGHAGPGR